MSSTEALSGFQNDQAEMNSLAGGTSSAGGKEAADPQTQQLESALSPTRYSFAKNFLVSMVSKMGIELEVEYFEREKEMLTKVCSVVVIARDVPLQNVFLESSVLAEKFKSAGLKERNLVIRCYAGDIAGKEIALSCRPKEVDYVIEATKSHVRPVLILCRSARREQDGRSVDVGGRYVRGVTGRTASGMVQEMLDLPPSTSHKEDGTLPDSPAFVSSAEVCGFALVSPERTRSSSGFDRGSFHPRKMFRWKKRQESADFAEERVENGWNEEEGGEGVASSQVVVKESSSSISSFTSDDSGVCLGSSMNSTHLTERPHPHVQRNGISQPSLGTSVSPGNKSPPVRPAVKEGMSSPDFTMKTRDRSYDGFFTLRPKKKSKQPNKTSSRLFPRKSHKYHCSEAPEITGPSPKITGPAPLPVIQHEEMESKSLNRQVAVRGKKVTGKTSGDDMATPTIQEVLYPLEVTKVTVEFKGVECEVGCREFNTVREIKDSLAWHLSKNDSNRCTPWSGADFALTYEKDGKSYELFNDWQFFYKTTIYQMWVEQGGVATPIQAHVMSSAITEDIKTVYRISQLVGVVLDDQISSLPGADVKKLRRMSRPDLREAAWTRRVLHNYVEEVISARNRESYGLSMELVSSSTSTILALKVPLDSKIEIIFHYKQIFSLSKHVKVQRTADSLLHEIFPCLKACNLVKDQIEDYTLQVSGERSYVAGNHELMSFRDIRRCIVKGEAVHLSLTEKPAVTGDKPSTPAWRPIDPLSLAPPLHADISSSVHHQMEVQALSSWDREDDFKVHVEEVRNLPALTGKTSCSVILEATLYHGDKPLCPPVSTSLKVLESSLHWRETINFKVSKKNLPRAAKILFLVSEALQRRESVGVKKTPKFLYWGLTMVFDHQGVMFNGEHTMLLWRGMREKEEKREDETYLPNPSGPASNNSDTDAVSLTIKFDSYGFPIHFPSCCSESRSPLLLHPTIANVALRKQFQRLMEYIGDSKLHSAVPAYIQKVNWGNLAESLEVYSLLDQLAEAKQDFPVEIALKLLDCDFPDPIVRGFATQVIHTLPDERLEDVLLQLTQALKFEPYHDSLLARFLLQRALSNKRVGHFFFWYLRCEMVNPQYTTRFGVILEAYLTGCGEAMLRQFEHQAEMQTTLEEIASLLKQRCNDDQGKMQALLPEMLEKNGVTQFQITPVYNPRIRLGNLRPSKCKIMASKKKPLWLEMSNVDETVLCHMPTRLILKMGDDLRQDMITLRMFSLFEKLWEEDGLDLALIPYGCIATGPDTGFIEVVKHARTIAEVSGVNNQTKLLDWIKSHQKNEFGEEDVDKVKSAVRMFVHSCAGYSVATYVLGIGDRHNDNIMVTTSGNLFHIDFGHFLGNIKYCMGFKREWAPFVLTPDFVYAMGGEDSSSFETYKNLCCRAFLTLRRHADLIINLFSLMRCTGIPELTCVEDTDYIRNALVLEKNEHEAEQMFRKVIKKCLDLKWTVQVMWKFHLIRKRGSS